MEETERIPESPVNTESQEAPRENGDSESPESPVNTESQEASGENEDAENTDSPESTENTESQEASGESEAEESLLRYRTYRHHLPKRPTTAAR